MMGNPAIRASGGVICVFTGQSSTPLPILLFAVLTLSLLTQGCGFHRTYQALRPPEVRYERHTSEEHSDFGVVYQRDGDWRRARRQYRWAVEKDPGNAVAWANLGNIEQQRGRTRQARTAYLHALAVKPGYVPAANNLAYLLVEELKEPEPFLARRILDAHADDVDAEFEDAVSQTRESIEALLPDPPQDDAGDVAKDDSRDDEEPDTPPIEGVEANDDP